VKRRLVLKRDNYDPRDKVVRSKAVQLPPYSSLEEWTPSVADQGQLGACTAFTAVEMTEMLIKKYWEWIPNKSVPADKVQLSQLFQYYNERVIEGDTSEDNGADSRTMMQTAVGTGFCLDSLWPYHVSKFAEQPPAECYSSIHVKPGAYHRVLDLETAKSVIYSGYPVSIGVTLYESFQSEEVANTGLVPMPGPNEQIDGGHEMWLFAYSDTKVVCGQTGAFKVRNHWSRDWGEQGNCWMPYSYIGNAQLCPDKWTLHFGKPWIAAEEA
jgi:C1A family cysteine protease